MMGYVVNYDPVIKLIHIEIYINTILFIYIYIYIYIYILAGIAQLV